MIETRKATKQDIPGITQILNTIELFPPEMLKEMMEDYLNNPTSQDIWFTAIENGQPIGFGYCAPEKLTEGTYNLYALGVRSDVHGKGTGKHLMNFIENDLKQKGHRLLIIDTSSKEEFQKTRKFYEKLNYTKEAVIRDFWEEGDDKVTFCKKLR